MFDKRNALKTIKTESKSYGIQPWFQWKYEKNIQFEESFSEMVYVRFMTIKVTGDKKFNHRFIVFSCKILSVIFCKRNYALRGTKTNLISSIFFFKKAHVFFHQFNGIWHTFKARRLINKPLPLFLLPTIDNCFLEQKRRRKNGRQSSKCCFFYICEFENRGIFFWQVSRFFWQL